MTAESTKPKKREPLPHAFKKGNTFGGSNKKKRYLFSKNGTNVFQEARNCCPDMLEVLYDIAMNKKEQSLVRVTAANSIMDRGMGKAVSHTIISADMASKEAKEIDITELSEDKLMLLIAQQERLLTDVIEGEVVSSE